MDLSDWCRLYLISNFNIPSKCYCSLALDWKCSISFAPFILCVKEHLYILSNFDILHHKTWTKYKLDKWLMSSWRRWISISSFTKLFWVTFLSFTRASDYYDTFLLWFSIGYFIDWCPLLMYCCCFSLFRFFYPKWRKLWTTQYSSFCVHC